MMKQFLLFLLFVYVFPGCATHCDEFNTDIVNWMPYNEGDSVTLLKNNEPETLLVVSSIIDHTEKIGFGVKCSCENSFRLNLTSTTLTIDILFLDSRLVENSNIVFNGKWLNFTEKKDIYDLHGTQYKDVIIFRHEAENDEIVLSKTFGIISIRLMEDEWVMMDKHMKSFDASKITMNNHNCLN